MIAIHLLFSYLLLFKVDNVNGYNFFTASSNLKKHIIGLRASSSSSSSSSSSTTNRNLQTSATDSPTTLEPNTNASSSASSSTHRNLQTSGYCSHDPTIQCVSVADCDGCIGRRLLRDNSLLNHRNLAKPACGDGTCRKTCADCASTDPECDPNHPQTCLAPTSSPTTYQVSCYKICSSIYGYIFCILSHILCNKMIC